MGQALCPAGHGLAGDAQVPAWPLAAPLLASARFLLFMAQVAALLGSFQIVMLGGVGVGAGAAVPVLVTLTHLRQKQGALRRCKITL